MVYNKTNSITSIQLQNKVQHPQEECVVTLTLTLWLSMMLLRRMVMGTAQQVRGRCTNSVDSYHHTLGSTLPAISSEPGAVTLVNMRFCPYAQRTVLCLNAKKVDYEIINSQLMTKV